MADFFEGSEEDRTETASAYRREEFRRQGMVALSREVLSVALLFSVALAFRFGLGDFPERFRALVSSFFQFDRLNPVTKQTVIDSLGFAARWWGMAVMPIFLMAVIGTIVACTAQVGWYPTWEPLAPNLERINPLQNLQRIFSMQGLGEALKSILKLAVALAVAWSFFKGQAPAVGDLFQRQPRDIEIIMLGIAGRLFFSLILALAVIAILDYAWQRYRLEQQMKVSKREAREEFKLREGDPMIKSRIRAIQRRIASRRMMDAVPKADVVVTNPTHFAVALLFDIKTMPAPKVVAKGAGFLALRIKELARKSGVPVVENKPLARTMFKTVEVGHFIPPELYKAVAQVLGYVYRLKGKTVSSSAIV